MLHTKIKSTNLFFPFSRILILWYFFLFLLILAYFSLAIIALCYQNKPSEHILFDYVDVVMPFIMLADILISLNTAQIHYGQIIFNRSESIRLYLFSFYFYVDLFAMIESMFQLIFHKVFDDGNLWLNLLIFVKIVKLIQINGHIKKYILKTHNHNILY